ncbi:MAG: hypothetical protein OXG46_08685 [Chloroflexi bacterium]|nr:hypothetical protein [Chloroflexota bacterium]MCY3937503.1 hypothetical protein [Chloroflexota bacterium]
MAPGSEYLRWDDPSLTVKSDTRWRACYRRLQSWYRETVLDVPPGKDRSRITRANMLPCEAVAKQPGLNFLSDAITDYALTRAGEVKAEGGTLERDRLLRNMLSSMPLCFNLFGALREWPDAAAKALSRTLDLDVAKVFNIVVEWAPEPELHLHDRTAFDAIVRYVTRDGRPAFLGIETKYTEPFSQRRYCSDRYVELTEDPEAGFRKDAWRRLQAPATNQLWRNALLAHSLRRTSEYDRGHVVVISCKGDSAAEKAIAGLKADLFEPASLLRSTTYEALIDVLVCIPESACWAKEFRRRYLDLSSVS